MGLLDRPSRPFAWALLVAIVAPVAYAAGEWRQKLASGITSEDSRVRADAVRSVEVDDKGGVSALLSVLSMKEINRLDGYIRSVAIARLAAARDAKSVEAIAKALVAKEPAHREAAAIALGAPEKGAHLAAVAKLLDDKDAGVRRAAIRSVGRTGDLAGVDLLLKRWERLEKERARDFREVLLLEDGLGRLTEAAHGRDRAAWTAWWDKSRDGYKRPSEWTEEEKKAAAEAKKKALEEQAKREEVSTTLRDVPLTYTASGKGDIPLLVIHDDTWNPRYLSPYLSSLEDVCRVYTMELPSITKLQVKKKNIGGFPFWPYDELCDAFDEMRKQGKHEKFAILAHGFSTMIAMRYLSKYGESVSHAILVGAFPGDDAYGNMLDKLSAKATGQLKDRELDNAIKFHFITDEKTFTRFYSPRSNDELEALERKFFTIMFANPQDPEIAEIWDRCKKPASTDMKVMESEQCQSPPFDILREQKPKVPVLVISGAKSIWFGPADGDRVAKNYPLGQHVVLPNSSMMPWFEESAAFADAVKRFFAKYPAAKK